MIKISDQGKKITSMFKMRDLKGDTDLGKVHITTRITEDGMTITGTTIKGTIHVKSVANLVILQRTASLGTKNQQEISGKILGTTSHHKHILQ